MIGPQKCPVYLKVLYLKNISERFSKKISKNIDQIFRSVRLRAILYTDRPLSGIYKDNSPTQEKSNIIYKFSNHCGSDYVGRTSQRFHVGIDKHVVKILKSWFDGRSEKPRKKYFSAIE